MASVSPIGNMIYINQNMPAQAQHHSANQVRFDMQSVIAMDEFVEKEKEIEEVRAPEDNHAIDPDSEHEKNKNFKGEEEESEKKDEHSKEEEHPKRGLLDISV